MSSLRVLAVFLALALINLSAFEAHAGSKSSGNFTLGIEGFQDEYEEPGLMKETTDFGAVTAGYTYSDSNRFFLTTQGRVALGENDYESPISGTYSGARQFEADVRVVGGQGYGTDGRLRLYTGLGVRYYRDESKGFVTDVGDHGYDRRIAQVYWPIGASYEIRTRYFSITPKAEADFLLYGNVSSRLQNVGLANLDNRQDAFTGYGLRGEVMLGRDMGNYALQFGPVFRYWDIGESNVSQVPGFAIVGVEPDNERTQVGAAARVIW